MKLQLRCPHCAFRAPFGVRVCQGCGAEVVYGATDRETSDCRWFAAVVGAALTIWLFPGHWGVAAAVAYLGMMGGPALVAWRNRSVRFVRYRQDHGI